MQKSFKLSIKIKIKQQDYVATNFIKIVKKLMNVKTKVDF